MQISKVGMTFSQGDTAERPVFEYHIVTHLYQLLYEKEQIDRIAGR